MGTMEKMDTTKHEVERKAGDFVALLVRSVEAAAGVGSLVRLFNGGAVRGWLPFRRRRSVWGTIGLLSAGAAVGAGISMLVAPMSGQDIRQGLLRGFQKAGRKGKELIETAEEEIEHLTQGEDRGQNKAEGNKGELAGKGETGNKNEGKGPNSGKGETGNKGEHRPGNATSAPMGSPGRFG